VPPEMATRFKSVANRVSEEIDKWIEMNTELREDLQAIQSKVIDISNSIPPLSLSQDVTEALDEEPQKTTSELNSKFEELQSVGDDIVTLTKAKSDMLRLVVAGFVEGEDIDKLDEVLSSIQDAQGEGS
jgi:vacuolar-type H+-ATPase subunit I/STV1